MNNPIKLTDTQRAVLTHAVEHTAGHLTWFPEGVKGGARLKVIAGLFNKALITRQGSHDWFVAAEGYDALGRARPAPTTAKLRMKIKTAVTPANLAPVQAGAEQEPAIPTLRTGTKQAAVIAMLQRPEGATISQICAATAWQAHTVRGAMAGQFKKKLGLSIVSEKPQGGERVYRVD